jgi:hypothetical protein
LKISRLAMKNDFLIVIDIIFVQFYLYGSLFIFFKKMI